MNCQDFSNIVNELAAYELMDAITRDAGRSHAAICSYCAAQLGDAQAVSARLLAAAGAEIEEAPSRVKQSLLAAFAAQQTAGASRQEEGRAPAVVIEISNWRLPWWIAAAGVAAAAVLVIASLLPSWLRVSKTDSQVFIPRVTPPPAGIVPTASPENGGVAPPTSGLNTKPVSDRRNVSRSNSGRTSSLARRTPPLTDRGAKSETTTVAKNPGNEYFPLTYLDSSTAMESGTVVRIELSRSALISLGLPMSVERADGLVKADLVVGDDGVARAIRLVQNR